MTVDAQRAGIATPWAAAGVMSFKPEASVVPRARDVNAQVARLLDRQEYAPPAEPLVAAR
jgi:hypothetical protein